MISFDLISMSSTGNHNPSQLMGDITMIGIGVIYILYMCDTLWVSESYRLVPQRGSVSG